MLRPSTIKPGDLFVRDDDLIFVGIDNHQWRPYTFTVIAVCTQADLDQRYNVDHVNRNYVFYSITTLDVNAKVNVYRWISGDLSWTKMI